MPRPNFLIRQFLGQDEVKALYVGSPHLFSIKLHHAGTFSIFPGRLYERVVVDYVDMVDIDKFSAHELDAVLTELGYKKKSVRYYHYLVPESDLDFGLRALGSDSDVMGLAKYVSVHKIINIYVEHEQTTVHTYFCSPSKVRIEEITDEELASIDLDITVSKKNKLMLCWHDSSVEAGDSVMLDGNSVQQEELQTNPVILNGNSVQQEELQTNPVMLDCNSVQHEELQHNDELFDGNTGFQQEQFQEFEFEYMVNDINFDPFFGEPVNVNEGVRVNENVSTNQDETVGMNGNDEEGVRVNQDEERPVDDSENDDSDYIVDHVNHMDEAEVDMRDFRLHTDADVEIDNQELNDQLDMLAMEDDVINNEAFDSGIESDEDPRRTKERKSLESRRAKAVETNSLFYVGQIFGTKEEIKLMIRTHAVETRRQIRIIKDDTERVRAVCKGDSVYGSHSEAPIAKGPNLKDIGTAANDVGSSSNKDKGKGKVVNNTKGKGKVVKNVGGRGKKSESNCYKCPWVFYLTKVKESWVVRKFIDEHNCLQSRSIYACTATFLGKQLLEQIQENPKVPPRAIQEQFQRKYQLHISQMKAFRAKSIASEQIHVNFTSQYLWLRDYVEELVRANPGTKIKIEVQPVRDLNSNERVFKRIYVCLGSLAKGFKAIGRDLLGLDGAFIKGPYPGQVLTAVGLDPNNGIYPVAYAIAEAENKDSWKWFLHYLGDDLGLDEKSTFTFISDRQKGLIQAVEEMFPIAEHRYCVRHMHENMKQKFKGKIYRDALWKLARHTTVVHFEKEMDALKKLNNDAHLWVSAIAPEHWTRSHFTGRALSDVLLNNMCETLNSRLVDGRDKPIITMLEYIREYLMRRIVNVLKLIDKATGILTPYAYKILESNKNDASRYIVKWNGEEHYQVSGANPNSDQYVVNMRERTCACRSWEISGIPCRHAVAAIFNMSAHGDRNVCPEMFVHPVYSMERWKATYSFKIYPVNGMSMWAKSQVPSVIKAPYYHKPIGRPKKSRRKSAVEIEDGRSGKKSKKGVSNEASSSTGNATAKGKSNEVAGEAKKLTCGRCKEKGHNKRTCTK